MCRYFSTYLGVVVRAGVVGLVVGKQGRCTFKVEAHVGRQVDVERIHVDGRSESTWEHVLVGERLRTNC